MIIITGAGGYVGRALSKQLSAAGYDLLLLTHGGSFAVVGPRRISLDLDDPEHCERLAAHCEGASTLIHLAGEVRIELAAGEDPESPPRASAKRFASVYRSNVVMTARLLELVSRTEVRHVVFASSQTVYGLPEVVPVAEDSPLAPLEHYAASKVACETLLALWARGHGRRATVLRFPGVWGGERRSGLVHSLCEQAMTRSSVRAGAEYQLPLDILHCDDVVMAFQAALEHATAQWRIYNIATGEPCSLTRLAEEVASLVSGCKVEHFGVPQLEIAMDVRRAADELGWKARPRRERLTALLASYGD